MAGTPERESRPFLLSCLMRFTGFISVLLAALPLRAAAQTTTTPPLPRQVRDSAFAVHQLFKKHLHSAKRT